MVCCGKMVIRDGKYTQSAFNQDKTCKKLVNDWIYKVEAQRVRLEVLSELTLPPPHYNSRISSLGFFIECVRFLPCCRRWRLPSWQRTWRCSWSTRRPSLRRSRSPWLRTAPPGRGRAATWNEHRYVVFQHIAPKTRTNSCWSSVWEITSGIRLKRPFSWCLLGGSVQAEAEAGETEEGGGVLWRRWDPAGGDQPVQGEKERTCREIYDFNQPLLEAREL